ncbi:hypothetical protein BJ742DRAFT_854310 [Cladochytrium replicatum]|nr:hypothetical protein BJ742DRAFT_854310 [Cladochytrium replicatum]
MLRYGCTRLEIGVQSVYEDVALDTNWYDEPPLFCMDLLIISSFHINPSPNVPAWKDAGYKIVAHMMPDLPSVRVELWH